jgi:hypothetical protein
MIVYQKKSVIRVIRSYDLSKATFKKSPKFETWSKCQWDKVLYEHCVESTAKSISENIKVYQLGNDVLQKNWKRTVYVLNSSGDEVTINMSDVRFIHMDRDLGFLSIDFTIASEEIDLWINFYNKNQTNKRKHSKSNQGKLKIGDNVIKTAGEVFNDIILIFKTIFVRKGAIEPNGNRNLLYTVLVLQNAEVEELMQLKNELLRDQRVHFFTPNETKEKQQKLVGFDYMSSSNSSVFLSINPNSEEMKNNWPDKLIKLEYQFLGFIISHAQLISLNGIEDLLKRGVSKFGRKKGIGKIMIHSAQLDHLDMIETKLMRILGKLDYFVIQMDEQRLAYYRELREKLRLDYATEKITNEINLIREHIKNQFSRNLQFVFVLFAMATFVTGLLGINIEEYTSNEGLTWIDLLIVMSVIVGGFGIIYFGWSTIVRIIRRRK